MKKILLLITIAVITLGSCSTEFNPNDEWKETMVVYGLLDQDSDTTWIRAQKCFLGEGNSFDYAHIMDSSVYAPDELMVTITEWYAEERNGVLTKTALTGQVFEFTYKMLTDKPEGEFFAPNQPVYYCRTKGKLYADRIYVLEVKNTKSGNYVTSETSLIGDGIQVKQPLNTFQFKDSRNRSCIVKWTVDYDKRARVFQPVVRFFYLERNKADENETPVLKYVDIEGNVYRNMGNTNLMQGDFSKAEFGALLKEKIGVDESKQRIMVDSVYIFIYAADENMSNYMSVSTPPTGIVQERPIFSNIDGGLGIFASRRTKIKEKKSAPTSPTNDYRKFIESLGLGF